MALESVALLPKVDERLQLLCSQTIMLFYRLDLFNSKLRGHMTILNNQKERTPFFILTNFQYPPPSLEVVHLDRRALPELLTSLA